LASLKDEAMNLNDPIFTDETKARAYFESIRWPSGKPTCPHCGGVDRVYRLGGKSHRPGLIHCNDCDGSFTVTTGGVMESSHIPLTKWALGFRLMAASKKGVSAHQLHRSLGVSYKSAWFMAHRIREAMGLPKDAPRLGGKGKIVEADETYLLKSKEKITPKAGGYAHKMKVLSLVERGGSVRSHRLVDGTKIEVAERVRAAIDPASILHTDGSQLYTGIGASKEHETVDHNKGYVGKGRKGRKVHTNTLEGYFSVFKRGMVGTYQHCGEQHLARYLAEFDFRQNNRAALGVNDEVRTERAIKGAEGKRLRYQGAGAA
jgi:transposase-like protein